MAASFNIRPIRRWDLFLQSTLQIKAVSTRPNFDFPPSVGTEVSYLETPGQRYIELLMAISTPTSENSDRSAKNDLL